MFVVGPAGDKANFSKSPDIYNFDEDSSDAFSPQQPASQQSPSSTAASPRELAETETTASSSNLKSLMQVHQYPKLWRVIKT